MSTVDDFYACDRYACQRSMTNVLPEVAVLVFPVQLRARNAAATRASLLDAARARFAASGYDGTALRDVAADAGVDAALVSRYFGSKDELFAEVLAAMSDAEWLQVAPAGFGRRMAEDLVKGSCQADDMDCLLVMLRSIGSAKAHEALRPWCDANFHVPLKAVVGGDDAAVRARLAGAVMLGIAVSRAIDPTFGLDEAQCVQLTERLAALLQECVST
jgi:AcrR family transcriptional regulator